MAQAIAHGGGVIAAQLRYPNAPKPWIDLSTGINPVPYPLPDLPAEAFTRLPEPELTARLEAVAALAYGARDPAMVVAGPGTQALIHLLPRVLPARRVAIVGPTFEEHAAAWRLAGAEVRIVAAPDEAGDAEVVVLCNPNNPDGRRYGRAELADIRAWLIVDEAFADLDGESLVPVLPEDRAMVLRSFGKTYGLGGVRLGFAIAPQALAGRIREAPGPWWVSGPAVHVGMLALADTAWREAAAERLAAAAERLDALLRRMGCDVVGGTRLFRLVSHPDADRVADRLGQAGILVRRFAARPDWLRFGIPGTEAAWQRLEAALC